MSDYPPKPPLPLFINSFSKYFNGFGLKSMGGPSAPASSLWPAANLTLYLPFAIPFAYPIRRLFIGNGSAAGGNFSIGLYTSEGTSIYTSGSVAGSGNDICQYVTPTNEIMLSPGRYYMGVAGDSTTANRYVVGGVASQHSLKILGMLEQSVFPVPASATFAVISGITSWPLCGFTRTPSGF